MSDPAFPLLPEEYHQTMPDGTEQVSYQDVNGRFWIEYHYPDGTYQLRTTDSGDPNDLTEWRDAEPEDGEPISRSSIAQQGSRPLEETTPLFGPQETPAPKPDYDPGDHPREGHWDPAKLQWVYDEPTMRSAGILDDDFTHTLEESSPTSSVDRVLDHNSTHTLGRRKAPTTEEAAQVPFDPDTPPPGGTEDPGYQAQEVGPLQFGNTGNFADATYTFGEEVPPTDDASASDAQNVGALQFGQTANFHTAADTLGEVPPATGEEIRVVQAQPTTGEVPPDTTTETPPVDDTATVPEQPPVAEQQPTLAPPPYDDSATGMPQPDGNANGIPNEYGDGPDLDGNGVPDEIGINPDNRQPGYPGGLPDGNANGIPGEYGDGPDLDANGIPDEIGINPDSLQPGYPNPPTSGEWGGVGVPDPTVVPQSDASSTGAEAMPEGYGDGSALSGDWVPEEAGIDPYALQQPAYEDPASSSTSGDGAWDPYGGSSDPYGGAPPEEALPEEAPALPEGDDPSASVSF